MNNIILSPELIIIALPVAYILFSILRSLRRILLNFGLDIILALLLPAAILTSCLTQKPAPVEDGSKSAFNKKTISKDYRTGGYVDKIPHGLNNEDVQEGKRKYLSSERFDNHNDKIEITPLSPINEKELKNTKKDLSDIDKNSDVGNNVSGSKSDIDLNNNADKLSENNNRISPPFSSSSEVLSSNNFLIDNPLSSPKFQWPVKGKVIARYGKNGNKFNEGVNIAAASGTLVHAAGDGKAVYIGNNIEGYGNLIIIKHEGQYMTAYAHLNDISVERGTHIKKGDVIGIVGQSGNVPEPQLHFSIRKGKKTINPEKTE
jgi:murein DD-endopeptidase MepM/ murein hydrolase activator NlpD